jgi:hypothetical protein
MNKRTSVKSHDLGIASVGIVLLVQAFGCAKDYRVEPVINTTSPSAIPFTANAAGPLGKVQVINPYTYNPSMITVESRALKQSQVRDGQIKPLYDIASDPSEDTQRRQAARNALVEAMIAASDDAVSMHLAGLKATQSNINVLLGGLSIGLTGAASVAAEATSKALAAAATGTQGARALINDEVYSQALAESIITLVKADRKQQADLIRSRYRDDLVQFPMEQGIALVVAYHDTSSVYNGLALARQAIEKEAIRRRNDGEFDRIASVDEQLAGAEQDLARAEKRLNSLKDAKSGIESANKAAKEELAQFASQDQAALTNEQKERIKALNSQAAANDRELASLAPQIATAEEVVKTARETVRSLSNAVAERLKQRATSLSAQSNSNNSSSTGSGSSGADNSGAAGGTNK